MDSIPTVGPLSEYREQFEARVLMTPGGCHRWQGAFNEKGYGYFYPRMHVRFRAHRFAWMLYQGPIPDGLQLDHLCRNRRCVNPLHLQPVTAQVNQLRGMTLSARLAARTECPRGHPFDGLHHKRRADGTVKVTRRCLTCHRERERQRV